MHKMKWEERGFQENQEKKEDSEQLINFSIVQKKEGERRASIQNYLWMKVMKVLVVIWTTSQGFSMHLSLRQWFLQHSFFSFPEVQSEVCQ